MAADGSIRIDTKLDASKAKKEVSSLGSAVKKLGSIIAAAFAIQKIVSFTKASVSAYATQIEVEQQLTTVLRNRYKATQDQIDAVKELTAAQQALGVVGDETQMSGLKTLGTYISNMEDLLSLTESMNDLLAFQYGYDATPEGATAVAKAMGQAVSTGSLSLLKRMGVAVSDQVAEEFALANESKRVAMLQELIGEKVGGVNAALANTPYGRIIQLKNAWGDFKELVGEAAVNLASIFVHALNRGLNVLSGFANKLIELSKAIRIVFLGEANTGLAKSAEEAEKAEDALEESVENVGEAIEGNLAGFDELNIMNDAASTDEEDEALGFSSGTEIGEESEVSPDLIASVQKFKDILVEIGDILKNRFEQVKEFASAIWGVVEAIRGGGDVGAAFSNVVDLISQSAMNLISSVQSFIGEHGEEIVEAAKNLILSLVQGISKNLPKMAEAAINIIKALVDTLLNAQCINLLVSAVVEIITTIIGAIADNLPIIVDAAITIILTLVEALTDPEMISYLLDAAVKIVLSLIEGITSCIPKLIEAAVSLIITLFETLTDTANLQKIIDASIQIMFALINGLIQAIPSLVAAIPRLISAIVDTLLNTNWLQVGVDIIKGIGEGLWEGVKNIASTIGDACKGIWSTIKGWFGINSPSKLMRDTVGNYIAEGIGEGFEDEIGNVADDMEKALDERIDFDTGDFGFDAKLPKFNTSDALPFKVESELCKEKGATLEKIAENVERIADTVEEIKDTQDRNEGGSEPAPRNGGGSTSARQTVKTATRENIKAGRTVIPVGT